jgi:hypothetical protein
MTGPKLIADREVIALHRDTDILYVGFSARDADGE